MDKNLTALMSCFARAWHSENSNVKVADDYLAKKLLSEEEYAEISKNLADGVAFFDSDFKGTSGQAVARAVTKTIAPSVLARTAFAEQALSADKKLGLSQYLIFASGYDSYACRSNGVKCFEFDMPKMIDDKISRLKRAGIDCSDVTYIKTDFNKGNLRTALTENGINFSEKVFCSMLGISYYLEKEAFWQTVSTVSELMCEGSTLVFDYPSPKDSEKKASLGALAAGAGEKMLSEYSYSEVESRLEKCGLKIYEHLGSSEADTRFFAEYNQKNPEFPMHAPDGVNYCLAVLK